MNQIDKVFSSLREKVLNPAVPRKAWLEDIRNLVDTRNLSLHNYKNFKEYLVNLQNALNENVSRNQINYVLSPFKQELTKLVFDTVNKYTHLGVQPDASFVQNVNNVAKAEAKEIAKVENPQIAKPESTNFVDVKKVIEDEYGGKSIEATRDLTKKISDHIATGKQVSLWFDNKEIPIKQVDGNRLLDVKGQPWGLLAIAFGQPRSGIEFKNATQEAIPEKSAQQLPLPTEDTPAQLAAAQRGVNPPLTPPEREQAPEKATQAAANVGAELDSEEPPKPTGTTPIGIRPRPNPEPATPIRATQTAEEREQEDTILGNEIVAMMRLTRMANGERVKGKDMATLIMNDQISPEEKKSLLDHIRNHKNSSEVKNMVPNAYAASVGAKFRQLLEPPSEEDESEEGEESVNKVEQKPKGNPGRPKGTKNLSIDVTKSKFTDSEIEYASSIQIPELIKLINMTPKLYKAYVKENKGLESLVYRSLSNDSTKVPDTTNAISDIVGGNNSRKNRTLKYLLQVYDHYSKDRLDRPKITFEKLVEAAKAAKAAKAHKKQPPLQSPDLAWLSPTPCNLVEYYKTLLRTTRPEILTEARSLPINSKINFYREKLKNGRM